VPNNVDGVNTLRLVLQSGIVVSGNGDISLIRVLTSGDAMTTHRISGATMLIALRQGRTETQALTNSVYTQVRDYVEAEIFVHYPSVSTSGAQTALRTLVNDFKITVASGSFVTSGTGNPPRPIFVGEEWPMPHGLVAKARLIYKFNYLL